MEKLNTHCRLLSQDLHMDQQTAGGIVDTDTTPAGRRSEDDVLIPVAVIEHARRSAHGNATLERDRRIQFRSRALGHFLARDSGATTQRRSYRPHPRDRQPGINLFSLFIFCFFPLYYIIASVIFYFSFHFSFYFPIYLFSCTCISNICFLFFF